MSEEKFEKIQERILYNIARALKGSSIEDLIRLSGNSLTESQVRNALLSLQRRKLVKKSIDKLFFLNMSQIERIKRIIGVHWESNWEDAWKNAK